MRHPLSLLPTRRHTRPAPRRARQRGLSLVELAIGMAILGVVAGLAFRSQELMEQYQQAQFVNKVQNLKAQIASYRSAQGRWPGDCNRDGLMDPTFVDATVLSTLNSFDYDSPARLSPATSSDAAYALGTVCPASTLTPFDNINVAYNELKLGGLLRAGEPNRKAASHGLGGFMYLGTFDTGVGTTTLEQRFNALVLTNVPIAAARRLAVALDGFDGSASNQHQVRRTDDFQSFAPLWTASGETELTRISVAVFFDRLPPSSTN